MTKYKTKYKNQIKFIHLRLINNAIPLETLERVFVVITNRQFDLAVDLENICRACNAQMN